MSKPSYLKPVTVLKTVNDLMEWRSGLPPSASVGFVPTMGALHAGHTSLLTRSGQECDTTVLSIFVNPTQFGPLEDLARYPRTIDQDLQLAQTHRVEAIFTPTDIDFYPTDFSTYVEETVFSKPLCGPFRPGHFRGVTTVVLKLLNLVRPQRAYFGLKDAQQFFVIQKIVKDLSISTQIIGCATLREADGLAMSSRNRYLSESDRSNAPRLYEVLQESAQALQQGLATSEVLPRAIIKLNLFGFIVQYIDLVSTETFQPLARISLKTLDSLDILAPSSPPALLAVAAHLGETRLIDNILITQPH